MSLTRRVAYNTIVQIAGKVLTTLISLAMVAALTRYLGVSRYGQYTTIYAFTQFFAVLADFGFFWFLVREISKPNAETEKITNNVLTFRSIVAAAIFLVAFTLGLVIPQYHDIRLGIGIIAAASFWMTLNGTYVGIFQNKLRMDKAAITDVLGRLVILGIVFWQIAHGAGLYAILWATFIGNLINFLASFFLGQVYVKFRFAFDLKLWKKIFWQCFPISIVTILGLIYFKIDTVMLSLLKTSTDVGIYGPPYKVLEILLLLPAIFMGNIFPIITNLIYQKDERLGAAFQRSFDFLVVLAMPIVIGIIFTAPKIITIIAGQTFALAHTISPVFGVAATSSLALQILIVACGISYLSHIFGYTVIALGKQTKLIWPNLFLVIFNIVLNLILIPKYSYIGAAATTVFTETCVVFLYFRVMRRYIDLRIKLTALWKTAFAGAVLAVVLWLLKDTTLWVLVPLGAISYAGGLWIVKGVPKDMIKEIIRFR